MQEILDTGDIIIATARKPEIPSFERTTLKNYYAVKLDIIGPSDIQSAFATALDNFPSQRHLAYNHISAKE